MSQDNNKKISTVEKLRLQKDRINARIQAIENRDRSKERKQETHKKVLVGAYYLDKAKKENTMADLVKDLEPYLTRNSDRILFGLEPITEEGQKQE